MSEQTIPTYEVELPPPTVPDWQRESAAFRRLLPELLHTHPGQYVAVYQEAVIDSGPDPIALIKTVRARLGNVTLHVGLVTDQPSAPVRFGKYREVCPE